MLLSTSPFSVSHLVSHVIWLSWTIKCMSSEVYQSINCPCSPSGNVSPSLCRGFPMSAVLAIVARIGFRNASLDFFIGQELGRPASPLRFSTSASVSLTSSSIVERLCSDMIESVVQGWPSYCMAHRKVVQDRPLRSTSCCRSRF